MAQDGRHLKRPEQTLILPLRLGAKVTPVFDAVALGEWIVGYPAREDEQLEIPDQNEDFGDSPPGEWLSNMINYWRSRPPHPEAVRRFLVRTGTFREWDWVTVKSALKSGLPGNVKEEIQRAKLPDRASIYVLRAEDFNREWRLVESLALMAGKLGVIFNPMLLKSEAEAAKNLLERMRKHISLPEVAKILDRSPATADPFAVFGVSQASNASGGSSRNTLPLAQQVKHMITAGFNSAFSRALRQRSYNIWWPNFKTGPRIRVEARSILGLAYLALLANFSRGWKRCARQDCGNIFRATDDKRKIFCSQYCGHLVSLRKKRKAMQKRKSKK